MKVCVTGANGFVGSNLCQALLGQGDEVCGLVRRTSDLQFIKSLPQVRVYFGDLTERKSLLPAFENCSVVYHVAALTSDWGPWDQFKAININGVRSVMEAAIACKVKRVVHISSVSVYGFPGASQMAESDRWVSRPDDPYVTSKQEGEKVALSYSGDQLEVVVIRPAGIYGPNDRTTTLKLLPEIEKRKFPYIDGGRYLMGPLYVDNLVQAILLAGQKRGVAGQAYHIADDGKTTWRQYVEEFCNHLSCPKPLLSVPSRLAWPVACLVERVAKLVGKVEAPPLTKYRVRAVMNDSHFSIKKAKKELGYRPEVTTREGIRRTVAWYREYQQQTQQEKGGVA
ncbi:MAG: NAD-dependent epimerase/dehydratase family protein [Deltaproteobacteria bacterium]|nr:NAD-dependent epimerase/dehydratase family protein [Deltaproteobacteria bacterium]